MELGPKFLLLVKVAKGLVIRDTPRPESQGGRSMRTVGVGTALYAYQIINVGGVDYARLVPQNPLKPEWVRVAEADHSIEYVDVMEMDPTDSNSVLADAITLLATAIRELARK
jgi:hypothetical protein